MKKLLFVLPATMLLVASCGTTSTTDEDWGDTGALDQRLDDKEDFDEAVISFADGEATDGEDYFFGVLAEVVEVDVKLREIQGLDEVDAEISAFEETIDECLEKIDNARIAMDLYEDETWPLRGDFHNLTNRWFDSVEGLMVDYLQDLADPMSRADDTWSDENYTLYEAYTEAYQEYLVIDNEWVEYQFTFADANGFELSDTETIDIDGMADDEVNEITE